MDSLRSFGVDTSMIVRGAQGDGHLFKTEFFRQLPGHGLVAIVVKLAAVNIGVLRLNAEDILGILLHIVDRVGGGDSFGGGLIYALLSGKSSQEAR